jgi:fermentation-respiration switch protein FrsA (DUF1100 family)
MYLPFVGIEPPGAYGLVDFTSLSIKTSDNVHIQAWYKEAKRGYPTIIYFHGNAGNLAHRTQYFSLLRDAGFGILGIDYRGYGASEGEPSEEGFYNDGRAAIAYAQKELALPANKIIIYGESIGSGVAVQMASEHKLAALILQAPFLSMTSAASYHYPWLPVNLLLKDRFDSVSKIANVHSPLLLLHGENDGIVPVTDGKELFIQANQPKKSIYFPETGHNNFNLELLVAAVLTFCQEQKLVD